MNEHTSPHTDTGTLGQDQAAAFENALDVLTTLIGHAAARLDELESLPHPDEGEVRRWSELCDGWATRRRELNPRDAIGVREVLERDGAFLRGLIEGASR